MRTSPPTRLPRDVYESASLEAERSSRTVPQQVAHWARLGRAVEAGNLNHRDIQRVLDGSASYDALEETEQAVVRSTWDERIDAGIGELDFATEFAEAGDTWVAGDGAGGAVDRGVAPQAPQ